MKSKNYKKQQNQCKNGCFNLPRVSYRNNLMWSARDVMKYLGYTSWVSFVKVIKLAKISCNKSHQPININFVNGKNDAYLTKYALFLIVQNGDPRKKEIANAQHYFAINAMKLPVQINQYAIDQQRVIDREILRNKEKSIDKTIKEQGFKEPKDFAVFKDIQIRVMYGKNTKELKKKRCIQEGRPLADFDSCNEMSAKILALALAERHIKRKNLKTVSSINREIRQKLSRHNIRLANLPPQKDIKLLSNQVRL